jgi:hypothetical protein
MGLLSRARLELFRLRKLTISSICADITTIHLAFAS